MTQNNAPETILPCPNPWCSETRKPLVVWDLYSKRVICPCGVKGPRSATKANTTQGVPINDALVPKAEVEAIAAWNARSDLVQAKINAAVAKERERCANICAEQWICEEGVYMPSKLEARIEMANELAALASNGTPSRTERSD